MEVCTSLHNALSVADENRWLVECLSSCAQVYPRSKWRPVSSRGGKTRQQVLVSRRARRELLDSAFCGRKVSFATVSRFFPSFKDIVLLESIHFPQKNAISFIAVTSGEISPVKAADLRTSQKVSWFAFNWSRQHPGSASTGFYLSCRFYFRVTAVFTAAVLGKKITTLKTDKKVYLPTFSVWKAWK